MSPWWGQRIRLFCMAAIATGTALKMGPNASDRLDSGNVFGPITNSPALPAVAGLWIDLTCDVLSVAVEAHSARSDAAVARMEAATSTVVMRDPLRKYDPLNPSSPWTLNGSSRLTPGVPVKVWAEIVNSATPAVVTRYDIFTGTADSWEEPWTPHANARRATLIASDATKDLAQRDWGEQPAVGTGDTVNQRITRILSYYNFLGPTSLDASTVTLQSTTLAQSAWELLLRAADDEIGLVYFRPDGYLRFINRNGWSANTAPVITVGCPGATYDIVTTATPGSNAIDVRNSVSAARTGGVAQRATSDASVGKFGMFGYGRTDLGLQTDPLAATWATFTLSFRAFPRANIQSIDLSPALNENSWPSVLALKRAEDVFRLKWTPPGSTDLYDVTGRAMGISHAISRTRWTVQWEVGLAAVSRKTFHVGPHAFDKLTDGNVMA
jgi:hypothetical protein